MAVNASPAGAKAAASHAQRRETDPQFVASLAKGLEILRCFGPGAAELTGNELVGLSGLPQPTVWRLCHSLSQAGVLTTGPNGRLRLGVSVLRLGHAALARLDLAEAARPRMQAIADRHQVSLGIAVRDDLEMVYIQRCESRSPLTMNLRIGSRIPLGSSVMGWAWMAALPERRRTTLIARLRERWPGWADCEGPFMKALTEFGARGYVLNPGVFHKGYNAIGVPLVGADGLPSHVLNCGGATSAVTAETLRRDIAPDLVALGGLLNGMAC